MTTDATKPAPKQPPDYGKTIPVRFLQFYQPHPKLDAQTSLTAEPREGHRRVSIEFIPALRHHRAVIKKPGAADEVVMFIYEGHVASFEPLA